jgi:hypothetical protein
MGWFEKKNKHAQNERDSLDYLKDQIASVTPKQRWHQHDNRRHSISGAPSQAELEEQQHRYRRQSFSFHAERKCTNEKGKQRCPMDDKDMMRVRDEIGLLNIEYPRRWHDSERTDRRRHSITGGVPSREKQHRMASISESGRTDRRRHSTSDVSASKKMVQQLENERTDKRQHSTSHRREIERGLFQQFSPLSVPPAVNRDIMPRGPSRQTPAPSSVGPTSVCRSKTPEPNASLKYEPASTFSFPTLCPVYPKSTTPPTNSEHQKECYTIQDVWNCYTRVE